MDFLTKIKVTAACLAGLWGGFSSWLADGLFSLLCLHLGERDRKGYRRRVKRDKEGRRKERKEFGRNLTSFLL